MKHKLFCLLIFLFPVILFAQSYYSVKGIITDSVEHINLGNTAVAVLQARDSILIKFTYAAADGSFSITGLGKGKFILLVSYPDYADYTEQFSLDSANRAYDFSGISMSLKSRLLKEVIIKGTVSQMKIKGDTTEFNAKAFVIQPNAKVEDLLKQLPGITVDRDGKITAQGETVNRVLVDGEEFFGDDPTLVTKNIRADMVDKVQVYDKKSDQAAFTGIDDGKKEKTINIKLKEDKKNGIFGKGEAGDSPDGIYQGQLLFNAFRARQKFSAYGTIGNNGKVGLGWQDNQQYGTGDALDFTDNGITVNTSSADDLDSFNGMYNGRGFPLARNGGVHYDSKWNDDKQSINANYKIGTLNVDGTNDNLTQNNLPGNILNSASDQTYHNYMFRQKLSAVYQVKLDTSSNLKISVDGTLRHSTTNNNYTSSEMRNDTMVNSSTRNLINTVDQKALNASAFYTKKFRKPGRTLSFLVSEAYSQSEAAGFLNSEIDFYNAQKQVDSTQRLDESKTNNLKSSVLNTNFTYSEPFSKTLALVVNYGIGINNSNADRRTFNPSADGVYNISVDSLSSDYSFNQFLNHAGAILNYKKGKTIFNFGSRVTDARFHQLDEFTGNTLDRSFINWAPQARYEYRFSAQRAFIATYNGNTTQPTLDQLQPIKVNNDPLNIVLGNPSLGPAFTNTFNGNYRSYKVIASQSLQIGGNYSFTTNPIVSHINYNTATGQSTSEYFNLPGKETSNFFFRTYLGRKVESLANFTIGINLNMNGNTYYNYSNDSLNRSRNYTFNTLIVVSKYKEKKIEFGINAGPNYTISRSSLQPNVNNNGWGFNAGTDATIYLPLKFQVGTHSDYYYFGKTESFPHDFGQAIINVFLIKSFLKNDNLKFELWGNDLFNQNVRFNRTATANLITQNSSSVLKRYFMFTIDYDFTSMAGGVPKK